MNSNSSGWNSLEPDMCIRIINVLAGGILPILIGFYTTRSLQLAGACCHDNFCLGTNYMIGHVLSKGGFIISILKKVNSK